jgi:hypothetical protein
MQWDHTGYMGFEEGSIEKGPSLGKLQASRNAFEVGLTLQLGFTIRDTNFHIREVRYCVADIDPISTERANLLLRSHPHDSDYCYDVIYGYNHKRGKGGNRVHFRKDENYPPIVKYDPARLPSVDKMMRLDDAEFIAVHVALMLSYSQHEGYTFPLRCSEPGCDVPIRHHLDLRRAAGPLYCPESFVRHAESLDEPNAYYDRIARLRPKSLSVPIYPQGIMGELRSNIPSASRTKGVQDV